jgi:hypothetical protein
MSKEINLFCDEQIPHGGPGTLAYIEHRTQTYEEMSKTGLVNSEPVVSILARKRPVLLFRLRDCTLNLTPCRQLCRSWEDR